MAPLFATHTLEYCSSGVDEFAYPVGHLRLSWHVWFGLDVDAGEKVADMELGKFFVLLSHADRAVASGTELLATHLL
jgi:hypothetical protein